MRGVHGDFRATNVNNNNNNNNALETINAAATVIASVENRAPQVTRHKHRWVCCLSMYWCFGHHRDRKRIGHAVLVPETSASRNDTPVTEVQTQAPAAALSIVAPPSSPASFLQSEPPSTMQSPAGVISSTSVSASMYSPSGPHSIFAIGPYAHETQLVSPPVFSTFTTEPSTAPFTPPPESIHLTSPSSPEVPFAQLLDPSLRNSEVSHRFPSSNYEFQSYQLHPGSPIRQLISPGSGISGSSTSTPFPDAEFPAPGSQFIEFRMGGVPKLLNLDKLSTIEWGSRLGSGSLTPDAGRSTTCSTPLDRQFSDIASPRLRLEDHDDDSIVGHRVSFELSADDDALSCAEIIPDFSDYVSRSAREEYSSELVYERQIGETSNNEAAKSPEEGEKAPCHEVQPPITLSSAKDFNFDSSDGVEPHQPNIGPEWWAKRSVVGTDGDSSKKWSFFPLMQPGVS